MIIKSYELDKIKIDLKFFLFYGKNEGLKKTLHKSIIGKK